MSAMALNPLATMASLAARDVRLAWRRKADTLGAAVFFIIVASLFPLGVGPEPQTLRQIASTSSPPSGVTRVPYCLLNSSTGWIVSSNECLASMPQARRSS